MPGGSPLDSSVLVLNRFYMAIRVIDVRRAMTLLYRDCAEVITIENNSYSNYDFDSWTELSALAALDRGDSDEFLRTPHCEILVPRLVRLTLYDKIPKSTVRFNRKNLFARDNHSCQYCGQRKPPAQLSLDHVLPRSQGGKTTWENVVCSCLPCNSRKGGRTPSQANMKLLSKPVRPHANPSVAATMQDPRYESWRTFLPATVA